MMEPACSIEAMSFSTAESDSKLKADLNDFWFSTPPARGVSVRGQDGGGGAVALTDDSLVQTAGNAERTHRPCWPPEVDPRAAVLGDFSEVRKEGHCGGRRGRQGRVGCFGGGLAAHFIRNAGHNSAPPSLRVCPIWQRPRGQAAPCDSKHARSHGSPASNPAHPQRRVCAGTAEGGV